jgi:hypothetical protein
MISKKKEKAQLQIQHIYTSPQPVQKNTSPQQIKAIRWISQSSHFLAASPTHTTSNAVTQVDRVSSLVHYMFPVPEFHLATAAVTAEQ